MLKGSHVMFPAASAPPMLFTLVLLNGLSAVSLNMFLPSLSNIAADFQAGYGLLASASIAGYAGMTTVLQLLIGPLSDRVGRRPVILVSLVIFVLASLGCLLARDVWTFLLFRTMQAAIVSGFVQSRVIIRDTEPAQKAASLMGYLSIYLSIAWAIVPMLAPMLGGAFDQLFGWRANFWAFLGFGAGMLALCWFDLGETNKNPSDTFTNSSKHFPVCSDLGASGATRFAWRFQWALSTPFLLPRLSWRQRCFRCRRQRSDSIWEAPPRASFSVVLSRGDLQRAINSQQ